MTARVAVVGSINMDLVVRCQNLPRAGETILAASSAEIPGGKGANQAVAAAKVGAEVSMIGRIGDDAFGPRLLSNLQAHQINTDHVLPCSETPSGIAVITVDDAGENSIVLSPGANSLVSGEDVEHARAVIEDADVLLVQLEVPAATIVTALRIAKAAGVKTVFDPAPAPQVWPGEFAIADVICPNETEAGAMTGMAVNSIETAIQSAGVLSTQTGGLAIITLGSDGAVICTPDGDCQHIPTGVTNVVDTTGSGDAFAGAFAVRWAETNDPAAAIHFANAAGSLAATRLGAQTGMGTRAEIDQQVRD